jgi:hypothetical protein
LGDLRAKKKRVTILITDHSIKAEELVKERSIPETE